MSDLHEHMLFAFIFHPHILDLEWCVTKGQVLEVHLLDQARWLVLLHEGLHSFLHSICCIKDMQLPCLPLVIVCRRVDTLLETGQTFYKVQASSKKDMQIGLTYSAT